MKPVRHTLLLMFGLFLAGQTALLYGQEGADTGPVAGKAPVITGFAIFGNTVTKPEIIMREITLQVGDTIDLEQIEYAKSRVYSLDLFNRVEISWPPMDSTILLIEVDERWYLYPVPLFGIVDRNWDHWYYGLGVKHENFRGRNEKIFAGFVLGYNPWVSLSYANPWILGDDELFTETGFGWSKVVNKSLQSRGEGPNFDEIHYTIAETFGKRLSPFYSVWLHSSFNYIEVTENRTGRTLAPDGIDRYITLGFGATHDTRNLKEYPTQGIFASAAVAKKGIGLGDVDMLSYAADVRTYKPIYKELSFAMRAFARLSSGPAIPNYEHHFFGFSERIRGHFHKEIEGENAAGASVELRIPIVPRLYLHVPQMPIRQFATWKLGLYAAVFADLGAVWDRDERPVWDSTYRGYGAGLHFLFPYGIVFRIDRAWSERGRAEWVFDIGASF